MTISDSKTEDLVVGDEVVVDYGSHTVRARVVEVGGSGDDLTSARPWEHLGWIPEHELEQAQEEVSALREDLAGQEGYISDQNSQIDELVDRISALESELEEAQNEVRDLTSELEYSRSQNSDLEDEIQDLIQQVNELEGQLE